MIHGTKNVGGWNVFHGNVTNWSVFIRKLCVHSYFPFNNIFHCIILIKEVIKSICCILCIWIAIVCIAQWTYIICTSHSTHANLQFNEQIASTCAVVANEHTHTQHTSQLQYCIPQVYLRNWYVECCTTVQLCAPRSWTKVAWQKCSSEKWLANLNIQFHM